MYVRRLKAKLHISLTFNNNNNNNNRKKNREEMPFKKS